MLENSELKISPIEESHDLPINSQYFDAAMSKAKEYVPNQESEIRRILTEIDTQGIDNFSIFETEQASFPMTTVSVTEIFKKLGGVENAAEIAAAKATGAPQGADSQIEDTSKEDHRVKPIKENRAIVIIPGFAAPPAGHPFTPWDMVYDRVFTQLPRLSRLAQQGQTLPDIKIVVIGSANSSWGKVTPQWIDTIKQSGFEEHGKIVAEIIERTLPPDFHIVINGVSMGAVMAETTMQALPAERQEHTQLLLENPADHYAENRIARVIRMLQLPIGFAIETARVLSTDPKMRSVVKNEPGFLQALEEKLLKKRIATQMDVEQGELKRKTAIAEGLALLAIKKNTAEHRGFIRRGVGDVVTSSGKSVFNTIRSAFSRKENVAQRGNRLEFGVAGGHQRDNFRVEKWARIVQFIQGK